jgi:hypothetical protein
MYYWNVFCDREYRNARKKPERIKVVNLQDLAKMTDKAIIIQVNNADINVNSPGNQIIHQQKLLLECLILSGFPTVSN